MPIPKHGETQESFLERCIPMVIKEDPDRTREQAVAICISKYEHMPDTVLRDSKRIAFDKAVLQDKIVTDNDDVLTIGAVIASEMVQQYEDGYAYKPADELRKMAETASLIGAVPVKILEHPGAATNYLLLKQGDVNGIASNFEFTKSLKDHTGRPKRRGVKADITWYKKYTPKDTIDKMVDGSLRDVSIGFTFDADRTAGTYEGQQYDYIQRNIFLNHVAAPIPKGRCPGPICGIGFDANLKYGIDETALNKCPVCRTIISVGIEEASKNLYVNYGPEVLRVIQGQIIEKPKPAVKPQKTSIDEQFYSVFPELEKRLKK